MGVKCIKLKQLPKEMIKIDLYRQLLTNPAKTTVQYANNKMIERKILILFMGHIEYSLVDSL
jgi:hypothetical protein